MTGARPSIAVAAIALGLAAQPLACSHAAPGVTHSARACAIAPVTYAAPIDARLHAEGTRLVDALGRVVSLRGVDAGGRAKLAPFAPFDYAAGAYAQALATYMDRAASWGIDVLRVPFVWAAVEPTPGADDAEFLGRYDALLDAAWARGIWTIVDFHQDVYAESYCGDGFPEWTIPDPKPAPHHDGCANWSIGYFKDDGVKGAFDRLWTAGSPVRVAYEALWDRIAARYADKPGVIGFEPINEPAQGTEDANAWEAGTLTAFYSTMVARLRAKAPSSLVFVDTSGADGSFLTTELSRPQGDGVVFAPHYYALVPSDVGGVPSALGTWAAKGQEWNVPVFVGEFGVKGQGQDQIDYIAAHFAAFDALGIGGSQWEYSQAASSWNDEGFSIVDADGTEHALIGAMMRPYARAVAGSAIAQSFDRESRGFTLTYAPAAGGVSEVALPARAYPRGYDVDLSGGCYDATSAPGRVMIRPDDGASTVSLRLTSR